MNILIGAVIGAVVGAIVALGLLLFAKCKCKAKK
jgi:gas vesicle protein